MARNKSQREEEVATETASGITVLNDEQIQALMAKSKQRGEYLRQLAAFLESGEPGVQVSLTDGIFQGKKTNSVKTGFEGAKRNKNAPEGAETVRVIVDGEAVYLIKTG